jgi:hypothetical protein
MPIEEVICGALHLGCSIGRTGPRRLRVPSPAPDRVLLSIARYDPHTGNDSGRDEKWHRQSNLVSSSTSWRESAATRMTDVK